MSSFVSVLFPCVTVHGETMLCMKMADEFLLNFFCGNLQIAAVVDFFLAGC